MQYRVAGTFFLTKVHIVLGPFSAVNAFRILLILVFLSFLQSIVLLVSSFITMSRSRPISFAINVFIVLSV